MAIVPTKQLKTGFALPVLGLGTWQMGGREERNPDNDDAADIAAIEKAISLGLTHIDTAESYASGYTETLIGQAITGYDRRELFITSKAHASHMSYVDLLSACQSSLERLNTDYLDLYLLHRYNPTIPLRESIRALDELVRQGLVKHIGVSNFGPEHLAEAQSYTSNKIVCDQVYYNLHCRDPEKRGLLQYCQENDVFLVAWRPIDKGAMLQNIPDILLQLCQKYKKTPVQVAINWLIAQSNVATLIKSSNTEHLKENMGALDWQMEQADIELLRRQYPDQIIHNTIVPLS